MKEAYITVTEGFRGHFAVLIWKNPDGDFWEPYQTSEFSYEREFDAVPEAVAWAEAEGLPFRLLGYDAKGKALN